MNIMVTGSPNNKIDNSAPMNAATIVGATVWSIIFETGVLMAYRAAASIARMIAMRFLSLDMLLICIYPSDNPAWIANSY